MKKPTTTHDGRGVEQFLPNHGADVTGVMRYPYSTAGRKDALARELAARDRITDGLIGGWPTDN